MTTSFLTAIMMSRKASLECEMQLFCIPGTSSKRHRANTILCHSCVCCFSVQEEKKKKKIKHVWRKLCWLCCRWLWCNRGWQAAYWACAVHLWKDVKPRPYIRGWPFWIHPSEEKFEMSKNLFSLLSRPAEILDVQGDLLLRTGGQSHCLGHEFRLNKSSASRHHLKGYAGNNPSDYKLRYRAIHGIHQI